MNLVHDVRAAPLAVLGSPAPVAGAEQARRAPGMNLAVPPDLEQVFVRKDL